MWGMLQARGEGEALGVVYALAGVLVAVLGVVLTIVKRSQSSQINGLGKRVHANERQVTTNCADIQELKSFRTVSEQDRMRLWSARGEDRSKMENVERQLIGMQADLRDLIVEGNQANTKAIHELALELRDLAARSSVAESMTALGAQLERAILARERDDEARRRS